MLNFFIIYTAMAEPQTENQTKTCKSSFDCGDYENDTNTMLLCGDKDICEPVRIIPKKSKDNRYLTLKMLTTTCLEEDVLFKCTLQNNKVVEICDIGYIRYSYGPKGAPEITLAVPREDVGFHCWMGVSDRGSSMNIPYGETTYSVGHYWHMNDPVNDTIPPAFLNVQRRDQNLATHQCKSGGNYSFESITEPSCMAN